MSTPEGSPGFDISKLGQSRRIAGGAAVLLLVSTFLNWWGVSVSGGASEGASGWSAYLGGKLVALIAILVIVAIVLEMMEKLPTLPVPLPMAVAGAGVLAFLLAAFHIFSVPVSGLSALGVDAGAAYGVYVAVLAAIGVAFGGWKMMTE